MWTKKEHKAALSKLNALAAQHAVTGRGRCAREGINCTLTGSAGGLRSFCYALREWAPEHFSQTDFKLTDGLEARVAFKSFSLHKKDELVNYDLEHEKAPSIGRHGGVHLDALEYHEKMKQGDTVIIDVRNAYESAIGHFQPPEGGATLIDPKMRNSSDWAKWLADRKTRQQLQNKSVMLYCTGGIRCERASALLNQMVESDPSFNVRETVQVRGGIERYLKTFPEGGFWKGKNYLFDKRQEQKPELKSDDALEGEVESQCCVCERTWGVYRGRYKCGVRECGVPVIVCPRCVTSAKEQPGKLRCPLCVEGYRAPTLEPDLVGMKRRLGVTGVESAGAEQGNKRARVDERRQRIADAAADAAASDAEHAKRLYVRQIPLVVSATKLREALGGGVELVQWLADKKTGAFYGAAIVRMASVEAARELVARAADPSGKGLRVAGSKAKKRLQVALAQPPKDGDAWPPPGFAEQEFPPIGSG
eukprot:PRCOL_00003794-RA